VIESNELVAILLLALKTAQANHKKVKRIKIAILHSAVRTQNRTNKISKANGKANSQGENEWFELRILLLNPCSLFFCSIFKCFSLFFRSIFCSLSLPLKNFDFMPHTQKITAAITAVGGYVPETKLTNEDLEKLVDTNDDWIRSRTGIEERRILREPGKGTSDLAAPAILQICEKRGISPEEIDCIICATVTPDMVFPATANIIANKIGAKNCWGFDLEAACSGFLYSLQLVLP
jgi:hypothetical protein